MNKYSVHEFVPNAAQIANGGNGGGNNPDYGLLGSVMPDDGNR